MSIAAQASPIEVDDFPAGASHLRLAVVTETYPPEVNGVALTLARLVQGLRERQHDVQLIRPRQDRSHSAESGERFHEVLLKGLPVPRYPGLKMGVPSKAALVSLWAHRRPDLVHIATEGPLGWSALEAARRLRLAVTSDFRTNFHVYCRHYGMGWLARPMLAYLRKFHNRTGCTMVPTEALRRELADLGFERLLVVPRGVDTVRFDPARRSEALRRTWHAAPDDPVVLYVGRLAPEKNLDALVASVHAMHRAEPRLRCVVVGDGPARADLGARLPQAHFAGTQLGDALAAHYASADLFVFPSLTETYGNVTAEAMASGLAVLAYHHAAAAQLIRDGVQGCLAPHGDEAAFVARAAALARDPQRRRDLGAAARQASLACSWDRVVQQVESTLRDVLHQGMPPRRPEASAWGGVPSL
jgi:glycosyltransferase involved in cell wall biosynthesis